MSLGNPRSMQDEEADDPSLHEDGGSPCSDDCPMCGRQQSLFDLSIRKGLEPPWLWDEGGEA